MLAGVLGGEVGGGDSGPFGAGLGEGCRVPEEEIGVGSSLDGHGLALELVALEPLDGDAGLASLVGAVRRGNREPLVDVAALGIGDRLLGDLADAFKGKGGVVGVQAGTSTTSSDSSVGVGSDDGNLGGLGVDRQNRAFILQKGETLDTSLTDQLPGFLSVVFLLSGFGCQIASLCALDKSEDVLSRSVNISLG